MSRSARISCRRRLDAELRRRISAAARAAGHGMAAPMPTIHGRLIAYAGSATVARAGPMMGIALAMARSIRWGPRTRPHVAPADGRTPRTGRAHAVLASIGK